MNSQSAQRTGRQPGSERSRVAIIATSSPPTGHTGLCKGLVAAGFDVAFVHSADAWPVDDDTHPGLVVVDLMAPVADTTKHLNRLSQHRSVPQIVFWGTGPTEIGVVEFDQTASLNWLAGAWHMDTVFQLEHRLRQNRHGTFEIDPQDVIGALEVGQIEIHYQPTINLRVSNSGSPVEALLRWRHPTLGVLTASEFLPTGPDPLVRRQLTDFALNNAVQQLRLWHDAGIDTAIAVNLDTSLLNDVQFPKRLSLLVREFDVPANRLHLEISEQGVMSGTPETGPIIEALTDRDFRLIVDDFGGSRISMQQVLLLPFAQLKISAELIQLVARSDRARRLARGIIHLAHDLDMLTCGKGVETAEQVLLLKGIGCDAAQGWYVGGAVPPAALNHARARPTPDAGTIPEMAPEQSG
jgi:EAL domain-containing protein (putative c-di-GMP-specific phosphodiesterase class I)